MSIERCTPKPVRIMDKGHIPSSATETGVIQNFGLASDICTVPVMKISLFGEVEMSSTRARVEVTKPSEACDSQKHEYKMGRSTRRRAIFKNLVHSPLLPPRKRRRESTTSHRYHSVIVQRGHFLSDKSLFAHNLIHYGKSFRECRSLRRLLFEDYH